MHKFVNNTSCAGYFHGPLGNQNALGALGNSCGLGGLLGQQAAASQYQQLQAQQNSFLQSGIDRQAVSSRLAEPPVTQPKGKSVFSEIAKDVKTFVIEHRGTLYFLAIALVLDHLLFKDAFRNRLQGMVEKVIVKVEQKIDA